MIGWIIFAAYSVAVLGFTVTIARFMARDSVMGIEEDSTTLDRAMLIMISFFAAWFWPLVIPCGWAYKRVFGGQR